MSDPNKYILFRQDFKNASCENSGVKAYNLIKYGLNTPDFIIISSEFYLFWLTGNEFNSTSESVFNIVLGHFLNKDISSIIVRSSAVNENFDERGMFLSEVCKTKNDLLLQSVIKIYEDFKRRSENTNTISLIIQEYREPIIQGHLSNERRVTYKKEQWIVEREVLSDKKITVSKIKASGNEDKHLDYAIYSCLNIKSLNNSLESIASLLCKEGYRYHIEWFWDGKMFWILQIDEEINKNKSTNPGSEWTKGKWNRSQFVWADLKSLEVFETIETSKKQHEQHDTRSGLK